MSAMNRSDANLPVFAWTSTIVFISLAGYYGLFESLGLHGLGGWVGLGLGAFVGFIFGSLWTDPFPDQEER